MKLQRILYLLILLPFLLYSGSFTKSYKQGELEVVLSLSETSIQLEDKTVLSFDVRLPASGTTDVPDLNSGDALKHFIHTPLQAPSPEKLPDGRSQYHYTTTLEPIFIREPFVIGSLTFKHTRDGKVLNEVTTEPISINVELPTDEELAARLNAPQVNARQLATRLSPPSWLPWIYGSLAFLVIALLATYLIRKEIARRRRLAALPPPPIPCWILAAQALEKLQAEKLLEQNLFMDYYNRLQDILRSYIENRFDIHAPERTTEEFMDELRSRGSASPVAAYHFQLERFLRHCDLVRFAAHIPEKSETDAVTAACRDFIADTTPKAEEASK